MDNEGNRPTSWQETCVDMRENEHILLMQSMKFQELYEQALTAYECSLDDQARGIDGWHERLMQADNEMHTIIREQRLFLANVLAYRALIATLEELMQKSDDVQFVGDSFLKRMTSPRFFKVCEQELLEFLHKNEQVRLPPPTHRIVQVAREIIASLQESNEQAVDE